MKLFRSFLLMGSLASLSFAAGPAAFAVVEKVAGQLGFYSASGDRISGVKTGAHPHEVVLSPDGRTLYVSNNGILWMQYAGEGGNTISVIDVATRQSKGEINLGSYRRPHGLAIQPKTGYLAATIENPDGLLLIDPVARKVVRKYDVQGEDPHMVLFDLAGEYAYVSNVNTHTFAAVHIASGKVKLIPVNKRPQGAVLTRDGKRIYLTCSEGNSIDIIDTATQSRTGSIASAGKGPGRLAFTPGEKMLVYNLQAGEGVGFADVASGKEVAHFGIGGKPLSLTLSADGRTAYLGLQEQDRIAVVSVPERKLVRYIQTPKDSGPDPVLLLP